jgi:1,4-dihydroxy-2-naphthoate octaprenyltransferase
MADRRTTAWVLWTASRPDQLLLVGFVYLLGVKAADGLGGTVAPAPVAAGGVALLPVAASVHYANEYADRETDALTERTPFSGGSGALPATAVPRSVVFRAGGVALSGGAALAAALALVGTLPAAAAGLLGLIGAAGWQYSVGPLRLAWRGLGELDNAALGGLVLPAYGAAATGGPTAAVALAAVPFFLVVLLNLFATQYPDREADAAVGKRTLAVRWPRRRLRLVYAAVGVAAAGSLVALHPWHIPTPVAAGSLAGAPLLAWGAVGFTRRHVPWPTVTGMLAVAAGQFGGWCLV